MRNNREQTSISIVTDLLERILNLNTEATQGQYDGWDISVTGKTEGTIELKHRIIDIPTFIKYDEDGGFMIQLHKYNKLKDKPSVYVNYFNFGGLELVLFWDLAKIDKSSFTIMRGKRTTEFENKEIIDKPSYLLKTSKSNSAYIRQDNDWFKYKSELVIPLLQKHLQTKINNLYLNNKNN